MAITIGFLTRREIDPLIHLLRLGFEEEISNRGADLADLERLLSLILLGNGLPLRALRHLTGHEAFVLIAKSEGRVVGCLQVVGRQRPSLIGIYVLPDFRGQGIALRLIEEALVRLKAHGHRSARGGAIDERSKHLVERAGFVPYRKIDLYRRSLPAEIDSPPGTRIEYSRKRESTEQPYDIRFLRRVIGFRAARITAVDGARGVLSCTLITQPYQKVGEIRPRLLVPGREDAFLPCLAAGCKWISRLKKEEVHLPLPSNEEGLADLALTAGFRKGRSWVHLAIDLSN
ncbi:MAG: GNAT family N-acetyltransferase [Candidatus Bipolaricaulota bacterium]|nr:GNAT family N-acetyltransferase [Candidatus Bipolaricaulota bacterium]